MLSGKNEVDVEKARFTLKNLILQNGLKWNEGLLNDGQVPKWIFDLREVILTPEGLKLTAGLIYEKIRNLDFGMIGGPSMAAEPLVASLILHFYNNGRNLSGFIVRKQPNDFGLRKKIEGPIEMGKKAVLIDDALNFGVSMFDAVKSLRQEGCSVVKIITLLDFEKSGHQKLVAKGYDVDCVFNLNDFGIEVNESHTYKKIRKLREARISAEKEAMLKRLNEISKERIIDFNIHKNLILATYEEGHVYCFSQDDYSIKWHLELGESISAPIFVDNDVIVISAYSGFKNSMLFFIAIEDGTVLKNIRIKGKISSAPVLCNDFYFVGSDDKKIYCIGRTNHEILWLFETSGPIKMNPSIDNDTGKIYLSSSDGNIYALNSDGKLIWKRHCGKIKNQLLQKGKLILNSSINMIFCLDKNNGDLIWLHELKNEALDIKILYNKVVIGCIQGYLLFLNINTGKVLDCFKVSNEDIKEIIEHQKQLLVRLENGKHYFV